jgi:hypothetical protein
MGGGLENEGFLSPDPLGGWGDPHGEGGADAEADGLSLDAAVVVFDFVRSSNPITTRISATTTPATPRIMLRRRRCRSFSA